MVKIGLANNKNTPKDILHKLATDKYGTWEPLSDLYEALTKNPAVSPAELKVLETTIDNLIKSEPMNTILDSHMYEAPHPH